MAHAAPEGGAGHQKGGSARVRSLTKGNGGGLRPLDLVSLRHTPAWTAVVLLADDDGLAFIEHWGSGSCCRVWAPIALLELVPGQIEVVAA